MSKYIIDIPKTVGMGKVGSVHYTYFDGIQCQTIVLKGDEIEELNSDYINEHFGDLQDTAYKKGLHDGESKCRYCNEYQRGFEDGKAVNDRGCEGCKYEGREFNKLPCMVCSNSRKNCWTANDKYSDIIRNGIHNWVTELNVKLDDIASILEAMRND